MRAAVFLLALSSCRCATTQPPPAPVPYTSDSGLDECTFAWRRLEALGCPEAASEAGVTFAKTCHDVEDAGVSLHPLCIANVADCSQVGKASRGEVACP